jgi:hypothetical protein
MSTWLSLGVLMVVGLGILSPALGDGWKHERGQERWCVANGRTSSGTVRAR